MDRAGRGNSGILPGGSESELPSESGSIRNSNGPLEQTGRSSMPTATAIPMAILAPDDRSLADHPDPPARRPVRRISLAPFPARSYSGRGLSGGVMVAQLPLEEFVLVRIQAGQPLPPQPPRAGPRPAVSPRLPPRVRNGVRKRVFMGPPRSE